VLNPRSCPLTRVEPSEATSRSRMPCAVASSTDRPPPADGCCPGRIQGPPIPAESGVLPRVSSDANTRWAAYEQQESLTPPPSTWCSVAWRSRGRGVKHATRSRAAVCVCLS
jgi:hypothetical protein